MCSLADADFSLRGLCRTFASNIHECGCFLSSVVNMNVGHLVLQYRSRISRRGVPTSWGGHQLQTRLHFKKFVCRNERIWTLRGARAVGAPLDPPMRCQINNPDSDSYGFDDNCGQH